MSIFLLILKLFPLIAATIQEIEATAPVPKTGPAKLQLLTKTVSAAYKADATSKNFISENTLLSIIDSIAADTVAFYNLVGIFKTTV